MKENAFEEHSVVKLAMQWYLIISLEFSLWKQKQNHADSTTEKSHTCYSENCFIKSASIAKTKINLAHDLYVAQMVLSNQKENELF